MNITPYLLRHNWDLPWNCYKKKIYQITSGLRTNAPFIQQARRIAALAVLVFAGIFIVPPIYILAKCARKVLAFSELNIEQRKDDTQAKLILAENQIVPAEVIKLLNGQNAVKTLDVSFYAQPGADSLKTLLSLLEKNKAIHLLALKSFYLYGPVSIDLIPILTSCSSIRSLSIQQSQTDLTLTVLQGIITAINHHIPHLHHLKLKLKTPPQSNMFDLMAELITTKEDLTYLEFDAGLPTFEADLSHEDRFMESLKVHKRLKVLNVRSFRTSQLLSRLSSTGISLTALALEPYNHDIPLHETPQDPSLRNFLEANQQLEGIYLIGYNFLNNFDSTLQAIRYHRAIRTFHASFHEDNILSDERLKLIAEIFNDNCTLIELSIGTLTRGLINNDLVQFPLVSQIRFGLRRNQLVIPSLLTGLLPLLEENKN